MSIDNPFDGYDIAQICVHGHVITSSLELVPNASKTFCDTTIKSLLLLTNFLHIKFATAL